MADAQGQKKGVAWFTKGDLNGFFGLFTNVLTNFLAAVGLMVFAINMPGDIVYGNIVPAMAISIGIGSIIFAIQAKKLSEKENRTNVTALPYGLSVPHYFVVTFAVMLPVYSMHGDWTLAWAVGISWNLVQGIIMTIGAFIGPFIRRHLPRAAMLGSLAGIALTYIAMNPMGEIYSAPYIGLLTLTLVLAGWVAQKTLPFKIPAGLFAIVIGMILAWSTGYMDVAEVQSAAADFSPAMPFVALELIPLGFAYLSPFLAAAIPLGIYDFLESLDNIESAEADGDSYSTVPTMLVPAVLTLFGSTLGSVVPTIIYIGHPGWKKAGARVGYSMATGIGVLTFGMLGLIPLVLSVIPLVALLPILVFITMTIGAQTFNETPRRHYPAMIIALMPFIASFVITQVEGALNAAGESVESVGLAALDDEGIYFVGWDTLGSADILVSMILATIVIYIIDRNFKMALIYTVIAAGLSYFGFMHAPEIGIGTGSSAALGYVSMGIALLALMFYKPEENRTGDTASKYELDDEQGEK